MSEDERQVYLNRFGDPSANTPDQANKLFKLVVSHLANNVRDIPTTSIVPLVKVLSESKLDVSDFRQEHLKLLE